MHKFIPADLSLDVFELVKYVVEIYDRRLVLWHLVFDKIVVCHYFLIHNS